VVFNTETPLSIVLSANGVGQEVKERR